MVNNLVYSVLALVLAGSIAALLYALGKTRWINRQPVENDDLKHISGYISEGAMAFLSREYKALLPFIGVVGVFLAVGNKGALRLEAITFILGAAVSLTAGYIGMKVATAANARTAQAAKNGGLTPALKIAFSGGSVMGMSVVGLALLGFFIVLLTASLIYGTTIEVFYAISFAWGIFSCAFFSCGRRYFYEGRRCRRRFSR